MTVSGKDKRGLVEEIRTLRTRLDRLERQNTELMQAQIARRAKTENTLISSELQYRATLDSMGDAIHVVDSELRIVLLNERFRRWGAELGLDTAHAVGRTIFELFLFLPETVRDEYRRVFEEGRVLTTEEVTRVAGGEITTETRKIPIRQEGRVVRVVTVVRDVTDRKRVEEAIQRQTELLDSIRRAQTLYITEDDPKDVFETLLETLVKITDSEYGFLDEVHRDEDGRLFKKSLALSDISWDEESHRLYERLQACDVEFQDIDNLSGLPARTGKLIISNDASQDSRSGGLPKGHPAIRSFMGIPMYFGGELVGVAGVANREGGYDGRTASFLETFISTCAGVIHAARENGKERQMAEALQEKARLQQILLDSMPCVVLLLRPGSRQIVASNKAGAEVGAVPGKTCYQTWTQSDSPCPWCLAPEVWATGQPRHREPVGGGGKVWDAYWVPISDDLYMHYAFDVTERRQAEKTLRETTGLLETIFAHTHILVAYLDPQFNFVRVNRAYAEIDGREPSFYVGRNHFDLYPNAENEAIFRKVVETGVPYFAHARPLGYTEHPERPVTCWDWSLVPIKEQNGAVSGLVLTLVNVTEQKRAEQTLREREATLTSVFRAAPVGIGLERDRILARVNDTICRMLGYSRDELVGRHAEMFYPSEEDYQRVREEKRRQILEKGSATVEARWKRKDGRIIDVLLSATVLDPADFAKGVTFTALDITERKAAEEAIRASEKKLRSIFETAANLITSVNEQGIIVDCNDRVREFLGYEKEEILDQPMARIIHPDYLEKAQNALKEILARGFSYNKEYKMVRKDGSLIDVSINSSAIEDEHGRYTRTLCIIDDITERKGAQQRLLDDREQLKSLASQLSLAEERERRRLATVLHDHVGQSLVFSKIKLDQMRKSESAGELTEALNDVSRRLGQVIQDTRTLTFDLSDPILYELGFEVAVAEWLTDQVQEKHGIETEFQDDGQAKPLDEDIRALLFRNVREVLINIIKHAQARRVKVAVGKADKSICVSVEDDGVGFDPVEVAATAVKKAEFGLFSIRKRLEQLGGRVEIESKPGRGTKITMTAPLKYKQANDGIQR